MADWTQVVDMETRRLFQVRHILEVLHLGQDHRHALGELADNLERKLQMRSEKFEPLRLPVMISREDLAARESRAGRFTFD